MTKQTVNLTSRGRMAIPMGVGIALGVALGAAAGHIALGLVAGIIVGGAGTIWRKRHAA